jgi:hypothetical protein
MAPGLSSTPAAPCLACVTVVADRDASACEDLIGVLSNHDLQGSLACSQENWLLCGLAGQAGCWRPSSGCWPIERSRCEPRTSMQLLRRQWASRSRGPQSRLSLLTTPWALRVGSWGSGAGGIFWRERSRRLHLGGQLRVCQAWSWCSMGYQLRLLPHTCPYRVILPLLARRIRHRRVPRSVM